MVIRKINTNYNRITQIIIVCIVFLIIIGQLTQDNDANNTSMADIIASGNNIQINQAIAVSGTINPENNFPVYTHIITTSSGRKIGVKSTTVNVNTYNHTNVQIYGKVSEYRKEMPVIQAESIYIPNQKVVLQDKTAFFPEALMMIKYGDIAELNTQYDNNAISISLGDFEIMRIQPYTCDSTNEEHNCTKRLTTVTENDYDTFMSFAGYNFYKINENTWMTMNYPYKIYFIQAESDETLLDVSNTIRFIDENYLNKKITNQESSCKDVIQGYTESIIKGENNNVIRSITKNLPNNTSVSCQISFSINFNNIVPTIRILKN